MDNSFDQFVSNAREGVPRLDEMRTSHHASLYGDHVARDPDGPSQGWPEAPEHYQRRVAREHAEGPSIDPRYRNSSGTIAGWAQRKYGMPPADPNRLRRDEK